MHRIIGTLPEKGRAVKRATVSRAFCWLMGHKSTGLLLWWTCDRCLADFNSGAGPSNYIGTEKITRSPGLLRPRSTLGFEYRQDLVYATSPASLDAELMAAIEWLSGQLDLHAYTLEDVQRNWRRSWYRRTLSGWAELVYRVRHYRWLQRYAGVAGFELTRRHELKRQAELAELALTAQRG